MQVGLQPIESAIRRALWDVDLASSPSWQRLLVQAARVAQEVARDLLDGQLSLRAMSLVYTSLLSLVPLLAVSFSVLKGFGVHNQIEPLLLRFLTPLGERAPQITESIVGFVDNMRVGVLGSVGLGILLYTVVSLIQKIENAFNVTWRASETRSIGQRFSEYLSWIMIGPVLLFSALGAAASALDLSFVQRLTALAPIGLLVDLVGQGVPYLFLVGAFTFVYKFVPSTRVGVVPALVGALVAALLWVVAGWIFSAVVASSARYGAIYSGMGILIVFMMWVYIAWLILLIGAKVGCCVQHPEYLSPDPAPTVLSARLKEKVALLIACVVGREWHAERPPYTLDRLARWLGMPSDAVGEVVDALVARGVLIRTDAAEVGYVPATALERIPIRRVLDAVRSAEEGRILNPDRLPGDGPIDSLLESVELSRDRALEERTLADLLPGQDYAQD